MPRAKKLPPKESVKKLIDNKGVDTTECLKVVGSLENLYAIANFWETQAASMQLIGINELLEYTNTNKFNSEQLDAFKIGLAALPSFFQDCLEEKQVIEKNKVKTTPAPSTAQPPMVLQ